MQPSLSLTPDCLSSHHKPSLVEDHTQHTPVLEPQQSHVFLDFSDTRGAEFYSLLLVK